MDLLKIIKPYYFLRRINRIIQRLLKKISIKLSNEDNLYNSLLLFHLSKLYSLSIVFCSLIRKRYYRESDIIIRSFLETYINLFYFSKKPKIRSHQFRMDEVQNIIARYKVNLKYADENEKNDIVNKIDEANKELEAVREYLKKIDSDTNYNKFKWKSISVETKAKEIGMSEDYDMVYRYCSKITHPSSTTGQAYLINKNENVKAILPFDYKDNLIPDKIIFIARCLIKTLSLLNQEFDPKLIQSHLNENVLQNLTKRFNILNPEI